MADPLPEELFHALAALIPRLIHIAEEECHLRPIDLLTLWHIRHFGKPIEDNRKVLLHRDVKDMLQRKFRFTDSTVSKMLTQLHEKGLLEKIDFTESQRIKLFGSNKGGRGVVIITTKGSDKIEEFKKRILDRFGRWLPSAPKTIQSIAKRFLPLAVSFAKWLVSRYETNTSEPMPARDSAGNDK